MIDQISGKVKCHVPLRLNFLEIRRKIHLKLISAVSCITVFTACKRSFRRLCFYTCVSVHRGVPGQVPPVRYPPSGPLHAGRYGKQSGGMNPPRMHSCCGKYFSFVTRLVHCLYFSNSSQYYSEFSSIGDDASLTLPAVQ